MVIKKHKPSLEGVLTRRRTTVAKYFENLGVRTHEQLVTVLEALIGAYRVSEELQEEAFAWVATLKKPEETKAKKNKPKKSQEKPKEEQPDKEPETIPQKEEEKSEPESQEDEKEKPKKASGRSSKRSTTKKSTTKSKTRKRTKKTSTKTKKS